MTLLFMDGFTNTNFPGMTKPEWNTPLGVTTGRDGVADGAGTSTLAICTFTPAATVILGIAYMATTSGDVFGNTNSGFTLRISTVAHLSVTWSATGFLQLRLGGRTGTILATATTGQFLVNQWRQIQLKAVVHTSAGMCQILVDGTEVINYTGQTGTASGSVNEFAHAANVANRFVMDDMWICDALDGTATDGRANNDFLGDLSIKALRPTAAGDSTQFTPSTGANWSTVDEATPNTSDYNAALAASGLRDLYNISDLPGGFNTVFAVRQMSYAAKSDAGTATLKQAIKENGTVTLEAASTLSTTYTGIVGTLRKKRPSDGAVFTVSDVNSLQIGAEAS